MRYEKAVGVNRTSSETIAVIPVRENSKRLPGKNMKNFSGLPLFIKTIEDALNSKCFSRIILTTDDSLIIDMAKSEYGNKIDFLRRDPSLATDTASTIDVVIDATLNYADSSLVALLQVTSPLRQSSHIQEALGKFNNSGADSLISVVAIKGNSNWLFEIPTSHKLLRVLKEDTQKNEPRSIYIPNGAIYISSLRSLRHSRSFLSEETFPYIMGPLESVDIDSNEDFKLAQYYANLLSSNSLNS